MIASICIINSERSADTLNSCCQYLTNDPNTPVSENILFAASIVLIFGSTLLSLTIHLPTIIIAWNIDPLYASKFAISFQSIILVNFYTFHYIYFALYNLQEWSSENKFQTHFISKIQDCCNRCNNVCLFILLYFVFVILSILGIIIPIAVFMVRAPVNEGATQGVTFIYSIVAAVLGALITIEIGWKSLSPPFSINDVLKRNMSRMKINPFDTNDRKWENYSEEQRMSKVVNNLIKYGHVYSAVALNHSSLQAQEAQNNQVYAGLIENVTGAPVNMHHSWPFPFRSIQSTTIDGFKRPRAITIIPGGNILVLERDGKCVSRIMANGQMRRVPHGNVCQLQWPTGISTSIRRTSIYICGRSS